jgi:diguanylate cyclase (GGDEF)-like protein
LIRVVRDPDFATRIEQQLEELRVRLSHRDAVLDALRAAHASFDPERVAAWLVNEACSWVPAPCWAVAAADLDGQVALLAEHGLTPAHGPALWGATSWVMRHGREFFSGNLAGDERVSGLAAGTLLAVPLACRGRTVGVLIGIDPMPSSSGVVPAGVLRSVRALLEPAAIALDNALTIRRAEALSVTDDLTRLYNSRYLNQVLRRETKRASRSGRPLSLLFIDLDGFKQVNDRHGHLAGSKALVEAGALVRACARETDVVARFGGDEFSVILPDTGREGAVAVAERVRDRIRAFTFLAAERQDMRLTASVGVATLPDAAGSAEELLKAADMAMYKVKAAGKNGIYVAEEQ